MEGLILSALCEFAHAPVLPSIKALQEGNECDRWGENVTG